MSAESFPRRRRHLGLAGRTQQPSSSTAVSLIPPQAGQIGQDLSEVPGDCHSAQRKRERPLPTDDAGILSDVTAMPGRERTQEFNAFAQSLQLKTSASLSGSALARQQRPVRPELQGFSRMAKQIGQNLSQTFVKLEKLTLLAKKRTLFDEHVDELDELTSIIKQDIAALNSQIADLQKLTQGNLGASSSSNQTQHSKSVVVNFQSRLATMSSDFKNLLEVRTENMKHQRLRRQKYSTAEPVPSSMPASASAGSLLLNHDDYSAGGGQHVVDMELLDRQAQQQRQLQLIDQQDSYIRNRAETMANIETTIVELGQIFAQLGRMVQEQGEVVQRIDSNIDETALHVESAHLELVKYFRNISRNRWLAFKVFAVLIALFIFFVIFML